MTSRWFRSLKERGAIVICCIATLLAVGMLFIIIGQIAIGALPSLSLYFLITPENKTPGIGQGIANAIVGTIVLSLFSTILATPFAIGTAVYLKRYAPANRLTSGIRFMIEVLSGTPSVVVGMFGLLVLVIYLRQFTGGFSLIAGTISLAILIIPVIERSIECAIDTVSPELEEGSYALGATKYQTIFMVTLPTAINGVLTGIILGFGRAAEESSVVVMTAGYSQFILDFGIAHNSKFYFGTQISPFNDLVASLPAAIYMTYENSNVIPMSNAYAIALVLLVFVLMVNLSAKYVCHYAAKSGRTQRNGWADSLAERITRVFFWNNPKGTSAAAGTDSSGTSPAHSPGIGWEKFLSFLQPKRTKNIQPSHTSEAYHMDQDNATKSGPPPG